MKNININDGKPPDNPPPFSIVIDKKRCKKCGICIAFCPKGVFESDTYGLPVVERSELCIKCMLCMVRCPDFACDVMK